MYNIAKSDGTLMLGCWVECKLLVTIYLHRYQDKYTPGKPYPNGKGFYPDFGFHIVEWGQQCTGGLSCT